MIRLIILIIMLSSSAVYASSEEAKLKALEKEIQHLQSSLNANTNKQAELENALKTIDLEISKSSQAMKQLNAQMSKEQKTLSDLEKQQAADQLALVKQQEQLKTQIRAAYLTGHNPLVKIMLMQNNPYTFSRLLGYYSYFNEARKQEITQLQASIQSIEARQALINQALAQQKSLQAKHLASFDQAKKEQALREQVLAALNKDIATKGNRINKLQSDAKALNNIIHKLQSKQDALAPPTSKPIETASLGKLPWPVDGVLTHKFGSQRSGNKVLWNGIFIKASEGAPVKAVRSGKIVFADWLRGYGLLLIVDHGNNTLSLYAYNESILKSEGEWVMAQETIATVGKSGGMADSGLYFEIRQAGNPIDPLKWIQKQG